MMFSNEEVAADYLQRLERERGSMPFWYHMFKLWEEAGEIPREYLKWRGMHRSSSSEEGSQQKFAEELADLVITAYAVALVQQINLDKAIQDKHTILMARSMGINPSITDPEPDGGFDEEMSIAWAEITIESPASTGVQSPLKAAEGYLRAVGLEPNEDAVDQLALAFTPCLRIICERKYQPDGATWRRAGRKGLVREILKNADRIHDRDWLGNITDDDSASDLINYCGMYLRAVMDGLSNWGYWGEPARGED